MDRLLILERLSQFLINHNVMLVTAESCTGGGVAAACTDLAGSSTWFEHGVVSYSNAAKQRFLGVPESILQEYGAVSEQTVRAMVAGASGDNQVALAVSGIAGPGGGSEQKPVGTVWFAWGNAQKQNASVHLFQGDRVAVREQAVDCALEGMLSWLESSFQTVKEP